MKTLKSLAIVFGVCLFLFGSTLRADDWDKKTIITFSAPVQVADTQLAAGTYTFKLMDNMANRHIVQILNADETQVIATIMAIPDLRLTPTGDTVVRFSETNNGSETSGSVPESGLPMREWFFAGDNAGVEFPVAALTPVARLNRSPRRSQHRHLSLHQQHQRCRSTTRNCGSTHGGAASARGGSSSSATSATDGSRS